MKKHFAHYYQLTNDELSDLLDSSLIALDANVLLDLYRYSVPTRRDFIRILRKLSSRLWLPHQAGQEFHANRLQVIKDGAAKVNEADKSLAALRAALDAIYRTPGETTGTHPHARLTRAYSILEEHLKKTRADAIGPTLLMSADPIWTAITRLFDGRVGDPYDDERLAELYKDGARRYQARRPPGFEDDKKPDPARYGDFIIWRQILDQAKSAGRPVVLITSERKSDWWLIQDGETMGPRPELREEMLADAGQPWHMYKPGLFMDVMGKRLDVPASEPALEEVRTLTDRQPDLAHDDTFVRDSYRGTLNEMVAASNRASALGAYAAGLDPTIGAGLYRSLLTGLNPDYLAGLSSLTRLKNEIVANPIIGSFDPSLIAGIISGVGSLDQSLVFGGRRSRVVPSLAPVEPDAQPLAPTQGQSTDDESSEDVALEVDPS